MLTNITHHVLNNQQWLQFIESSNYPKDLLSAIILTGWSRFDHFMPLCDLLPTAYPSLIYSLHMLNTNQFLVDNSIHICDRLLSSIGKDPQLCELLPGNIIRNNKKKI
jgi:hexosaminidase